MEVTYPGLNIVHGFNQFVSELRSPGFISLRNPQNVDPTCGECLFGCCITMRMDMTPSEMVTLAKHCTIFVRAIGHFLEARGKLLALVSHPKIEYAIEFANSIPGKEQLDLLRLHQETPQKDLSPFYLEAIEYLSRQHEVASISRKNLLEALVGICGCVTRDNILERTRHCSVHKQRPEKCKRFEEGGDSCQDHFIWKGSAVASTIVEGANYIEPTLHLLSVLYGVAERQVKQFQL